MKKQNIIVGIVVLLLTIELSGCTDQNGDNVVDSDVELVNTWIDRNTALDGSKYDYYKGTVKNVAGKMLNKVTVSLNFYDSENNFLFYKTDTISNLANSYTKDFSVTVYSYQSYYENIDHVEYKISTS